MSANLHYAPVQYGRSSYYSGHNNGNNNYASSDTSRSRRQEKLIFQANRNTARRTFVTLCTNFCNMGVTFACFFFGVAIILVSILAPSVTYIPGPAISQELVVQLPSTEIYEDIVPVATPPPQRLPPAEFAIGPSYSSTVTDEQVQCSKLPFALGNSCLSKWAVAGSVRLPNGFTETMRFRGNTCGAVCESVPGLLSAFTGVCVCTTSPIIYG